MAGSSFAGPIAAERDPSLAFLSRARSAIQGGGPTGERPLEARIRTLQATAGNAAVGQYLQRQAGDGARAGADETPKSHSLLQFGAQGDEVRDLQSRLNQANATQPPLKVDGIFGRKTQSAVRAYQRANPPLQIDGDAGVDTWAALDRGPAEASGDAKAEAGAGTDDANEVVDPFQAGKEHYANGRYGQAYDEFTKAYERTGDPAHLFNRAQALRLLGGRREHAKALYEQLFNLKLTDAHRLVVQEKLDELRGPGKSGDEATDKTSVRDLNKVGARFYGKGDYARAYDEFTKAWEITRDPAMLWNRAQSLYLLGGRRSEAIIIFEQMLVTNVPDDSKEAARMAIASMRGPTKSDDEAANKSAVGALMKKGRAFFRDGQYPQAHDVFSDAYKISNDHNMLYNIGQTLRLMGGRRDEAIAMFVRFLAANVSQDQKKAARAVLEDLRGPGKPPD